MFRWLRSAWYSYQRGVDLDTLWPECKKNASDLDQAKAAFALHAFNDPAWQCLGDEIIYIYIETLT